MAPNPNPNPNPNLNPKPNLVEVRRRERPGSAPSDAAAVVVIATFVSHEAYVSIGTKLELSSERSIVFGRPVRAEQSGQATDGACVLWRAESLSGHSVAHGRYEPPPKRDTYHPANRLQLGHLCHPRHARRTGTPLPLP